MLDAVKQRPASPTPAQPATAAPPAAPPAPTVPAGRTAPESEPGAPDGAGRAQALSGRAESDNGRAGADAARPGGGRRPGETDQNDAVIRRIERASGLLANKAVARMAEVLPWYPGMSARHRADIQLVVQAGIASFVEWCRRPEHARELSSDVFRVAPRELVRAVTFRRLVDLVRVAVETIEAEVPNIVEPEHEQRVLADVLRYSRDIAFAGAVVYARVAEERGAWDARLEALVVDHVVRGDQDRALSSRAAAVGWRNPPAVTIVVGPAPPQAPEAVIDEVHRLARANGLEVLTGVHNQRLLMIVGGRFRPDDGDRVPGGDDGTEADTAGDVPREAAARAVAAATGDPSRPNTPSTLIPPGAHATERVPGIDGGYGGARWSAGPSGARAEAAAAAAAAAAGIETAMDAARVLLPACGPGPVVVGPVAADLSGAAQSARAALAAADVVAAWPAAPRPVSARALLPERALAGDAIACRTLIDEVYVPLRDAGAPLLETAGTYLDFGASLEATAKALYLHPNTVRYRLRKASEVCGLDTADHRQRFTLHIALLLGRLENARTGA
ncbi:MAG: helix-turn-helix domain-containing protein [Frankia sp.]|nr:helix-turn-helix domain-containing protein [Frankia sp.]